jgi:hypothetical protein
MDVVVRGSLHTGIESHPMTFPRRAVAHSCESPRMYLEETIVQAAPDGAGNTIERRHKRDQQRTALMVHNTLEKEGGSPAQTLPLSHPTTDDPLRFELREHVRKLRRILRQDHGPIDHEMASHIRIMRALMNSFARLHHPPVNAE